MCPPLSPGGLQVRPTEVVVNAVANRPVTAIGAGEECLVLVQQNRMVNAFKKIFIAIHRISKAGEGEVVCVATPVLNKRKQN